MLFWSVIFTAISCMIGSVCSVFLQLDQLHWFSRWVDLTEEHSTFIWGIMILFTWTHWFFVVSLPMRCCIHTYILCNFCHKQAVSVWHTCTGDIMSSTALSRDMMTCNAPLVVGVKCRHWRYHRILKCSMTWLQLRAEIGPRSVHCIHLIRSTPPSLKCPSVRPPNVSSISMKFRM